MAPVFHPATGAGKLRDVGRHGARHLAGLPTELQTSLHRPGNTIGVLAQLEGARQLAEALSLLSYALPEREAVWWACMCVGQGDASARSEPGQQQVLLAARDWVRCPDAATRARCLHAAKAVGAVGSAALVARAAFAANLADAGSVRAGWRVEQAVAAAAATDGPGRLPFWREHFLLIGHDIAAGGSGRIRPGEEWA